MVEAVMVETILLLLAALLTLLLVFCIKLFRERLNLL